MINRALFSTLWSLLIAISALSCATSRTAYADPPPDRRVEVRVTVTVPQGAAVPVNFPVQLSGAERVYGAGINAQGVATVVGTFPADTTEVFVTLDPNQPLPPTDQASQRPIWRAAQVDANKRFSLPPSRKIELTPGQEEYNISIDLRAAITVSGTLKKSPNTPISAAIIERQDLIQVRCFSGKDGTFEIYGVPKGKASYIFIELRGLTCETWAFALSSVQTAQNLSLGELTLDGGQYSATLDVQIDGTGAMPDNLEMKAEAVCFVRASDARVFQFLLDSTHKVRFGGEGDTRLPKISPGDYFVVPGFVSTSSDVLKLLHLLHAGRRQDVESAGLTLFSVAANSTVERTVDISKESTKLGAISE